MFSVYFSNSLFRKNPLFSALFLSALVIVNTLIYQNFDVFKPLFMAAILIFATSQFQDTFLSKVNFVKCRKNLNISNSEAILF